MSSKLITPLVYLEANVNITVDINIKFYPNYCKHYVYQP